jgi:MFS family permease
MATSNSHLEPHAAVNSQSDSSSFVEVTPSPSPSSSAPSDNSLNLRYTPDISTSGSNDDSSGSRVDGPENIAPRPQPGSTELPRLRTQLNTNDDDIENAESAAADKRLLSADGGDDDGYSFDEGYDSEMDFKPRHRRKRRGSTGAGASAEYTVEEEKEVVKKLDRRLVLFLSLLYLLSFLDRSSKPSPSLLYHKPNADKACTDIGNAKIAGLSDDLRLSSSQYEWLLTAFYITYIAFEWMTLMYKLVPAHIYISICVYSWGVLASCQALTRNFWDMLVIRALLGISEAAFGPGAPFYLSFFYKREELAYRTALFISAAPLATSFASSLAWVIVTLSSSIPVAPWRSLFLIEGFPSLVAAVFAWILIPDSPGKASFLTPRQRKVAKLRLQSKNKIEHHTSASASSERFNWKAVVETLCDPMSYLVAVSLLPFAPFSCLCF